MDSECLICGDQFSKGSLDLLKHSTDITLRHQISKKQTSTFRYDCSYNCGLYFLKKGHLNLHYQNVCGSKAKAKRISLQYLTSTYDLFSTKKKKKESSDSNQTIVVPVVKQRKLSKNKINDGIHDDHGNGNDEDDHEEVGVVKLEPINSENSFECMVCGKLFPRSTTDLNLQGHITAHTIKHATSLKRTAAFSFGCKTCGTHFTTQYHLNLHTTRSTCNPDMMWPTSATGYTGLRAIHRSQLSELSTTSSSSSSSSSSTSSGNQISLKRKRDKLMFPNDRKIFYQIITLLLDPSTVPDGVNINESNYKEYLPNEHLDLVRRLKLALRHVC